MEFIPAKKIVTACNGDSWFGLDYKMNIYRGCCHGCIYCDSRSECYHIDDFDTVRAKENAIELVYNELKSKTRTGVIGTGAMSDPYNPFEQEYKLTRAALEIVNHYGFGIAIATKSNLIKRDIDILSRIKKHSPVLTKITITAYEDDLSKKIEPGAPESSKRFDAIANLSDNGIFSGILLMPVLPFIQDNESNIMRIIEKAKVCGAKFIYADFGVTLRQNQREYYYKQLDALYPDLKQKYVENYGNDYRCGSLQYQQLYKFFSAQCEKLGLIYKMQDIIKAYKSEYETKQISLF